MTEASENFTFHIAASWLRPSPTGRLSVQDFTLGIGAGGERFANELFSKFC